MTGLSLVPCEQGRARGSSSLAHTLAQLQSSHQGCRLRWGLVGAPWSHVLPGTSRDGPLNPLWSQEEVRRAALLPSPTLGPQPQPVLWGPDSESSISCPLGPGPTGGGGGWECPLACLCRVPRLGVLLPGGPLPLFSPPGDWKVGPQLAAGNKWFWRGACDSGTLGSHACRPLACRACPQTLLPVLFGLQGELQESILQGSISRHLTFPGRQVCCQQHRSVLSDQLAGWVTWILISKK